jgi:hypothetical protein
VVAAVAVTPMNNFIMTVVAAVALAGIVHPYRAKVLAAAVVQKLLWFYPQEATR